MYQAGMKCVRRFAVTPLLRYRVRSMSAFPEQAPSLPTERSPAMIYPDEPRYGDLEYWNKRYAEQASTTFDWYQSYDDLAPILRATVPRNSRILMAGCGNSGMSNDMVNDGYQDILNIDWSPVLIDTLKAKNAHIPQLKYKTMNMLQLHEFPGEQFDAIIDKGMYDSMRCSPTGQADGLKVIRDYDRVMKTGGHCILVTYDFPLKRVPIFMQKGAGWRVSCYVLPKPYSGRSLEKYPEAVPMGVATWVRTKREQYESLSTFVYVGVRQPPLKPFKK